MMYMFLIYYFKSLYNSVHSPHFLYPSPRNRLPECLTLPFTFSKAVINILMYVPLKPIFFLLCLAASYYMLFEVFISDGRKADIYVHGIGKIAGFLILKKIKIYVE